MEEKIKKTIKESINFIFQKQQKDGSFFSLSSEKQNLSSGEKYTTSLGASFILSCLSGFSDFTSEKIKKKIVRFLLKEKSDMNSFNYWSRSSKEARELPYPDDLDDTFCVLASLFSYDKKIINAEILTSVISLLSHSEIQEGGPYQTWLVGENAGKEWRDIDLAVNSNVAYFLFLQEIELPNLGSLIETAIKKEKYFSPYYASPFSVIYFISRFYQGKNKDKIIGYLWKEKNENHSWGNSLDSALAISALLNLGFSAKKLEKSINNLIAEKGEAENWKAYSLVVEKINGKTKTYSGSNELTTAFCLEAIGKYSKKIKTEKNKNGGKEKISKKEQKIYERVIRLFESRKIKCFGNSAKEPELDLKKILRKKNSQSVVLLPFHFQKSLGKKGEKIPTEMVVQLGLANLLGWIAYTIYDDFLDEEGEAKKIALANLCLRELTKIFYLILPDKGDFLSIFERIMDETESANFWEIKNCRIEISEDNLSLPAKLPDYQKNIFLTKRSMGHALPALVCLSFLGEKNDSPDMKNLIIFFQNYLLARQLNDDMHDWEDDLKRGQLSPVVSAILETWKNKISRKKINLKKDWEKLQEIFWYETVLAICREILYSVKKARRVAKKISLAESQNFFEELILPMERLAQNTISEQKEMSDFLEIYKRKK